MDVREIAPPGEETLLTALRRQIAAGPLPAERVLAASLGVSRHQLRRALAVLREEGALPELRRVTAPPARGDSLVRGTNPIEVIELRMVLEPPLVRLAALRASPFEIQRIERAATTPAGADPGAADLVFHGLVAAGAHNALASEVYALLRKVGADARLRLGPQHPYSPGRVAERDAEHQAIAAAIAARDPDRAESAMRAHLDVVQQAVVGRLSPAAGQKVA